MVNTKTKYYFSDANKKKINKSRIFYSDHLSSNFTNLPILENDTKDIIEYTNEIEEFENKKPRIWWKLLETNEK